MKNKSSTKKAVLTVFLLSLLTFPKPSFSTEISRVVDGDTFEVINLNIPKKVKTFIRLYGIDTPEKAGRAKCEKEARLAEKASTFATNAISEANKIRFEVLDADKYGGRYLAKIYLDGVSLSTLLIENGLAVEYYGDRKKSWCD